MKIVFETPRLILRQFTESDASLILQLNSDPEVIKYVHEKPIQTEEEARKIITDIILPQYKNDLGRWAIHAKDSGDFIGWCGLKYIEEVKEIDLGYRLMKSFWGNHYATEAAEFTLKYGFTKQNLSEIVGRAHIENIASWKILEKIGMTFVRETNECDGRTKVYSIKNT